MSLWFWLITTAALCTLAYFAIDRKSLKLYGLVIALLSCNGTLAWVREGVLSGTFCFYIAYLYVKDYRALAKETRDATQG